MCQPLSHVLRYCTDARTKVPYMCHTEYIRMYDGLGGHPERPGESRASLRAWHGCRMSVHVTRAQGASERTALDSSRRFFLSVAYLVSIYGFVQA